MFLRYFYCLKFLNRALKWVRCRHENKHSKEFSKQRQLKKYSLSKMWTDVQGWLSPKAADGKCLLSAFSVLFGAYRLPSLRFKVGVNGKHLLLVLTDPKWETSSINGISFTLARSHFKAAHFHFIHTVWTPPPPLIAELDPIYTSQTSGLLHSN